MMWVCDEIKRAGPPTAAGRPRWVFIFLTSWMVARRLPCATDLTVTTHNDHKKEKKLKKSRVGHLSSHIQLS